MEETQPRLGIRAFKYSKVTLVHRRNEFRWQHTLSELRKLEKAGKIMIKTLAK